MIFTEYLLHFIWRFRLFDHRNLISTAGERIRIENIGQYNHNAGPDFEFARIRIGNTLWSGQVEIHIREEDWLHHRHQLNKGYDNTILHVVWEESVKSIYRTDGTCIPTLVLKDKVDSTLLSRYEDMMENLNWIPCEKQIAKISALTVQSWLSRMAVERLEYKLGSIQLLLEKTHQDWERVFMVVLGRSFGMKVNAAAFEDLCMRLDLQLLQKYRQDKLKITSLVFGLAGFLDLCEDDYSTRLKMEYDYLKRLHRIEAMRVEDWRFLRMRPFNFPTYRLGQLISLFVNKSYWFAYILEVDDLKTLFKVIDASVLDSYWATHYRFGKITDKHSTSWSTSFKIHLTINCFIPMLFAYGEFMKIDHYKERALNWLNELPAEVNQITKAFVQYNVKCQHAADSQGLLFMKSHYCDSKQCLSCAIGLAIFKN